MDWAEVWEKFEAIAPKLKAGSWPALFTSMAIAANSAETHLPGHLAWAAPIAVVATHFFVVLTAHRAEEAVSALSGDSSNHDLEMIFASALRVVLRNAGAKIARRIDTHDLPIWFKLWDRRLNVETPEDASRLFHSDNPPDPTRGLQPSSVLWPFFEQDLLRWATEQKKHEKNCELDTSKLPKEITALLSALPEETFRELSHRVRDEKSGRAWIAWQQRFLEESARIGIAVSADVNAMRKQLNRMEQLLLAQFPPQRRKTDPTSYLKMLTLQTEHIDIDKLRVPDGSVKQFHITELYTPLTTVLAPQETRPESGKPDQRGLGGHRTEPLQDALRSHRLLLIGDPGAGKSTFLRRIAFDVCNTLQNRPGEDPEMLPGRACPFPILISAFSFAEYVRKAAPVDPSAPGWAVRFLASQQHFDLDEEYFRERLREGCLLMIDGLDEVTDWSRHEFVGFLESLAQVFGKTQIVATSRPAAYGGETDIHGFKAVKIGPLERDAIRLFVEKWFGALKRPTDQAGLIEAIESRPEIEEMASNPVMLTALAALQSNGRRIPEQRSELYDSILLWLAEAKEKFTKTLAVDRLSRFRQIAFAMSSHSQGKQVEVARLAAAEEIKSAFRQYDDEGEKIQAAERFLKEEETYSGIVISRGSRVRFWHLTFQEHLAAQFLMYRPPVRQRLLIEEGKLYDPAWRETVLLLAGLLYGQALLDDFASEALDRLPDSATLAKRAECVGLIGRIVRDLRPYGYQPVDGRYKKNLDRCLAIFDVGEARSVPFETRLEAADALGQAGDPRLHEDNWVPIEGGSFWMGAQKTKKKGRNYGPEADDDEGPAREVKVAGFRMGRYPVTVFEYESFVNHKGYEKEELWRAGGFGQFQAPEDWQKQLAYPNRPVVGVSWYEASAYCAWIGARLPTEVEWEYAARFGREGARYPWGNEAPDATRANFREGGPGYPTPVGLYPAGATLSGVQDMAGNVWEWTASDYSKATKVLRGCAWDDSSWVLRVSFRLDYGPGVRVVVLGFRCVRELLSL